MTEDTGFASFRCREGCRKLDWEAMGWRTAADVVVNQPVGLVVREMIRW